MSVIAGRSLFIFGQSQLGNDFLQIIPASCFFLWKDSVPEGKGDGGLNCFSIMFNSGAFRFSGLPAKKFQLHFPLFSEGSCTVLRFTRRSREGLQAAAEHKLQSP